MPWRHVGSWCIDPYFLHLDTSWKLMASFTSLLLKPWMKETPGPFGGGWVGPRASLDDIEKWKFLILPGLKLRPLGRPANCQSLQRLRYWSFSGKLCWRKMLPPLYRIWEFNSALKKPHSSTMLLSTRLTASHSKRQYLRSHHRKIIKSRFWPVSHCLQMN
jgi:hypothetical protein